MRMALEPDHVRLASAQSDNQSHHESGRQAKTPGEEITVQRARREPGPWVVYQIGDDRTERQARNRPDGTANECAASSRARDSGGFGRGGAARVTWHRLRSPRLEPYRLGSEKGGRVLGVRWEGSRHEEASDHERAVNPHRCSGWVDG
jgi:hypothetical protein